MSQLEEGEFVATEQAQQQHRREASGQAVGETQSVAVQAKEQVQEKAGEAKEKASDKVRTQLNVRSDQAGEQIGSFAQALHKAAEHLQTEGNDRGAKVAHQAGHHVQRLAGYLSGSDADRFLGDIESFSRRRPWAAGTIGVAAGFIASRFLKASAEGRHQTAYRSSVDADLAMSRGRGDTALSPSGAGSR